MNWEQIGLFVLYVLAMLMSGLAWHGVLVPKEKVINRFVHLGEALLLGSMIIVGEMLLFSMLGLYKAAFLWSLMAVNILCVFLPHVRRGLGQIFTGPMRWGPSVIVFIVLLLIFAFRNCYLLLDIDSHSTYLLTQKLWLEHGSSIFASTSVDMKIFAPGFNAVPYALGLSVFPIETFFPQMVVAFWTVIVLFLVFGYVSARWSKAYALAAVMFVLLDDHMFYSGANTSVVIDSALLAFLFAGTYNFWEARRQNDPLRFVMALIFLSQILSNKYQLLYSLVMMVLLGVFMQSDLRLCFRSLWKKPVLGVSLLVSALIFLLWPLKNYLATGCPFFPVFADRMHILGWTADKTRLFTLINQGPLSFGMVIRYLSYLLSWPWLSLGRLFALLLAIFPSMFLLSYLKKKDDPHVLAELCYWFSVTLFIVVGICMISFCDPRHYRYGIAIMSVAAILTLDYIFIRSFGWSKRWATALILIISLEGWPVIIHQGGPLKKPDFLTNLQVLQDKLHMHEFMNYFYPNNAIILGEAPLYSERVALGAWDTGVVGDTHLSLFLLPTRPHVNVWFTTVVRWDSYQSPALVADDLINAGIFYVMVVRDGHLYFESPLEYGQRIVAVDRHPKDIFYDYGFPGELAKVNY